MRLFLMKRLIIFSYSFKSYAKSKYAIEKVLKSWPILTWIVATCTIILTKWSENFDPWCWTLGFLKSSFIFFTGLAPSTLLQEQIALNCDGGGPQTGNRTICLPDFRPTGCVFRFTLSVSRRRRGPRGGGWRLQAAEVWVTKCFMFFWERFSICFSLIIKIAFFFRGYERGRI